MKQQPVGAFISDIKILQEYLETRQAELVKENPELWPDYHRGNIHGRIRVLESVTDALGKSLEPLKTKIAYYDDL